MQLLSQRSLLNRVGARRGFMVASCRSPDMAVHCLQPLRSSEIVTLASSRLVIYSQRWVASVLSIIDPGKQ